MVNKTAPTESPRELREQNLPEKAAAPISPAAPISQAAQKPPAAGEKADRTEEKRRTASRRRAKFPYPAPELAINNRALRRLRSVAVAYSHVKREDFPTEEAYLAEKEVESRAESVLGMMTGMGIPGKLYPADEYFLTSLLVDRPDLVINLVDTLRGKDVLQTSVSGALELVGLPYTGAGMRGLVIGNDRNMVKQLLIAAGIPTPAYQFISRAGTKVNPELGLPLIVKLNEGGGSVGIDNHAVKESLDAAQKQVDALMASYHLPVIVEKFIDGPEITVVVFEDSRKRHIFMGKKGFGMKPDGKHEFTSLESYSDPESYHYEPVNDAELERKIEDSVTRAFTALYNRDYAKYDIRVDEASGTPYLTDCNPNTAFGPHIGLPFTEIIETLYGLKFEKVLAALLSKYAKKIKRND